MANRKKQKEQKREEREAKALQAQRKRRNIKIALGGAGLALGVTAAALFFSDKESPGTAPQNEAAPAKMNDGSFDTKALRIITSQLIDAAQGKQYIGIADTGHSYPEIAQFNASETLMKSYADAGVKHLILESEVYMEALHRAYGAGEISEEVYLAVKNQFVAFAHSTPEEERLFEDANMRLLRHAHRYGIQIHCVDFIGYGEVDPEHSDLFIRVKSEQVRLMKDYVLTNPHMAAPQNAPALERQRHIILQRILSEGGEPLQIRFVDASEWTVQEGGPRNAIEQRRYRFLQGDPQIAAFIQQKTGSERTVINYGMLHFLRAGGDVDHALGDDNVFVANLFANQVSQTEDFNPSLKQFFAHMGQRQNQEPPEAVIDLSRMSFETTPDPAP